MNKKYLSLVIVSLIFCPLAVSATGVLTGLNNTAAGTGLDANKDLITFVGKIIGVILGLLGAVLVVILIYAGIMWGFLARGDNTQIKKAKEMIINAVIGLAIVLAAYAITTFVFTSLNNALVNNVKTANPNVNSNNPGQYSAQ